MIGSDVEVARALADRLWDIGGGRGLPEEAADHCRALLETVRDPVVPGALVPLSMPDGEVLVVAAAGRSDWRRLSPVLRAFAGPTMTSFNGAPTGVPTVSGLAEILEAAGASVSAAIRLPAGPGLERGLRALRGAVGAFRRAPVLTRSAPEPTSWLLSRFQDHLNVGRRDAAQAVLDRLKDELRLDALNLKALRVQLHAAFGEWPDIVGMPGLSNLVIARRTPATTGLLLEALYQVHVAPIFDQDDRSVVLDRYRERARTLALQLMTAPLPRDMGPGAWRLVALEILCAPGRADLGTATAPHASDLGWLANDVPPAPKPAIDALSGIDEARAQVSDAAGAESVDAMASALAALERLTEDERRELARAEPFRSALQALMAERGATGVPSSWTDWLRMASEPAFRSALEVARLGAAEWAVAVELGDPSSARALLEALEAAQSHDLAAERTALAMPFLVAWLRRDPAFPNSALVSTYASLLTFLALRPARDGEVYGSSLVLVDAVVDAGADAATYRNLVDDALVIAGDAFGVSMVYWALGLVEIIMGSATPDASARGRMIQAVLAGLMPLAQRLSSLQREALRRLGDEFGWSTGWLGTKPKGRGDTVADRLQGRRVAIYSLAEGASRQAKVTLEEAAGVEVTVSAEHGGSSQLRALATNSDLFVIVWSAATHAATDFIRAHRGSRPLVYSEGKGFTSIVRAVEEFAARATW